MEEIRPRLMARPTLIFPQWPDVVVTIMFQLPSNGEALTGDARQKIARAAENAHAYIRLLSSLIPVSPTLWLLPLPILV